MNKQKILTAIALTLVFLIPNHIKLKRSSHGEMEAIRLGVQWFGYGIVFAITWTDMGDTYRNHIEGEK
jgi:hypothetical protein